MFQHCDETLKCLGFSFQELLEETMSKHDPGGTTLCIHSVVTTPGMRRRGVAQQMLADYIAHVRAEAPLVGLIKLLTKPMNAPLCPFIRPLSCAAPLAMQVRYLVSNTRLYPLNLVLQTRKLGLNIWASGQASTGQRRG